MHLFLNYQSVKTHLHENSSIKPTKIDEIEEIRNSVEQSFNTKEFVSDEIIDSLKLKPNLNQEIWDKDKLKPKISKQLIKVANDFIENIDLSKKLIIKDILFTGSLANYNWSKFSDIDLHIVLDFKKINDNEELLKDYFWFHKNFFSVNYDINVLDYPVEVYIQDVKEKVDATAIFSLLNNKWVDKPEKQKFKINVKSIKKKTLNFVNQLKDIKNGLNKSNNVKTIKFVKKLKEKVVNMRKVALAKDGEFSEENLVFKVLRRTVFFDILTDIYAKAYSDEMSIVSLNESINSDGGVIFIIGKELDSGEKRLYGTTTNSKKRVSTTKKNGSTNDSVSVSFNGNPIYRIMIDGNQLTPKMVGFSGKESLLNNLNVSSFTIHLNENKVPFHWESMKFKHVKQATNSLKHLLVKLDNIRWVD